MHGVREELIDAQAKSIGIPLRKVYVFDDSNEEYEHQMNQGFVEFKNKGIKTVAFGDIFLEDLRLYREEKLNGIGMSSIFPIWNRNTRMLVHDFIDKGFVSYTCCVADKYLSQKWVGRKIDREFIEELPPNVDCCGENGEYHTFCSEGPIYKRAIEFVKGPTVYRPIDNLSTHKEIHGFWYCDFLPQ
jgi:uncharacterized protein (TIGR00290 family)